MQSCEIGIANKKYTSFKHAELRGCAELSLTSSLFFLKMGTFRFIFKDSIITFLTLQEKGEMKNAEIIIQFNDGKKIFFVIKVHECSIRPIPIEWGQQKMIMMDNWKLKSFNFSFLL